MNHVCELSADCGAEQTLRIMPQIVALGDKKLMGMPASQYSLS